MSARIPNSMLFRLMLLIRVGSARRADRRKFHKCAPADPPTRKKTLSLIFNKADDFAQNQPFRFPVVNTPDQHLKTACLVINQNLRMLSARDLRQLLLDAGHLHPVAGHPVYFPQTTMGALFIFFNSQARPANSSNSSCPLPPGFIAPIGRNRRQAVPWPRVRPPKCHPGSPWRSGAAGSRLPRQPDKARGNVAANLEHTHQRYGAVVAENGDPLLFRHVNNALRQFAIARGDYNWATSSSALYFSATALFFLDLDIDTRPFIWGVNGTRPSANAPAPVFQNASPSRKSSALRHPAGLNPSARSSLHRPAGRTGETDRSSCRARTIQAQSVRCR